MEERAKKSHRRPVSHGPDGWGRAVEHQGGAQSEVAERSERPGRRCPAWVRVSHKEADRPPESGRLPDSQGDFSQGARFPRRRGMPCREFYRPGRHAGARNHCIGSRRFPARCLRRGKSHRIVPGGPGRPVDERVASCARERPGLRNVAGAKAESREDRRVADSKQRIGE